jgi:mono/diheme cytochrome c family protein
MKARDAGRAPIQVVARMRIAAAQFHPRVSEWQPIAEADAGVDAGGAMPQDPVVARGEYLVRHVAGCMECHTPRLPSGRFDESKLLSGVENLADAEPDDDARGALHSRNLTPDDRTGLGRWSDEQIKDAFQHGVDDEGTVLHWFMPYWIFRNMEAADADAVVAFLRSIPIVVHNVADNQPNAVDLRKPYVPYQLPVEQLPTTRLRADHTDFASAQHGRYLATSVTPCLLCHTPAADSDPSIPIDVGRAFTGRRQFVPIKLGTKTAVGEEPPFIESFNLTPHEHGIGAWSPADVSRLLRQGVSPKGLPTCDPMPSYTGGSFTGMTEDDALDLGNYFTSLAPKDTGEIPVCCTACHNNSMDGEDAGGL